MKELLIAGIVMISTQLQADDELKVIIKSEEGQQNTETTRKILKNLRTYINRDSGILTIKFDLTKDIQNLKGTGEFFIHGMTIILFDKNGQLIKNFNTDEMFRYPNDENALKQTSGPGIYRNGVPFSNFFSMKPVGNTVKYRINQRDAAYIKIVEISFS
jgi:hypothetical protein